MHFLFILLTLLGISQTAYAEKMTAEQEKQFDIYTENEYKKSERKIPLIVKNYATSMGCVFSMNPKNVVPYKIGETQGYVAAYSLDLGCTGGTSMVATYLVFLERAFGYSIVVNPNYSNPRSTLGENFPGNISLHEKDDEILIQGVELGPNDALCCPSAKVKGKIYFEGGLWKLMKQ